MLSIAVVLSMSGLVFAADATKDVYLKGTGNNFAMSGWQDVFYMNDGKVGDEPQVWHIVYTDKKGRADIQSMQLDFGENGIWHWDPATMPFSTNGGGNNWGWVIVAPAEWTLYYVNSGNNNKSGSFVTTTTGKNVQFNVSGYNSGKPGTIEPRASLKLQKTVDGLPFGAWAYENFLEAYGYPEGQQKLEELLGGISFILYAQDDPDKTVLATGSLAPNGTISFALVDPNADLPAGYYVVEELLTGELAAEMFADVGPMVIYVNNGKISTDLNFDYDALYTIVNGYSRAPGSIPLGLSRDVLNNGGDIFYIGITNVNNNEEFLSFCGNAGSEQFAGYLGDCHGYMKCEPGVEKYIIGYDLFMQAYNFIEDNLYGGLAGNRVVVQTVTWILLGADFDYTSEEFANLEWWRYNGTPYYAGENAYDDIMDVMAWFEGYDPEAPSIVDIVFMVCDNPTHNFLNCQPQVVPVFAGSFDNQPGELYIRGTAAFMKMALLVGAEYALPATLLNGIEEEFEFTLEMLDGAEFDDDGNAIEYPLDLGKFYPDGSGMVIANDLLEGSYVFKETAVEGWQSFYGLDEDADGLYFRIVKEGNNLICVWDTEVSEDDGAIVTNIETPRGEAGFTKFIELYEEEAVEADGTEGFKFDLYMLTGTDPDVWDKVLEGIEPDEDGVVKATDLLPGLYYFVESSDTKGWQVIYGAGATGKLEFEITDKGLLEWITDVGDNATVSNVELPGALNLKTTLGKWFSMKDSITGGYSEQGVNPRSDQINNLPNEFVKRTAETATTKSNNGNNGNGNNGKDNGNTGNGQANNGNNGGGSGSWFQFNALKKDKDWKFDLVNGDKLTKVGEYTVVHLGDGWFEFKAFDKSGKYPLEFVGAKVSISNTIQFAQNKNDSAFNANNIWTHAPGQQQFSAAGHTFKVYAPWVDLNAEEFYVYIHLEGLQGLIDYDKDDLGITPDSKFDVRLIGPAPSENEYRYVVDAISFTATKNGLLGDGTIKDIKPGTYDVEIIFNDEVYKTIPGVVINRDATTQKNF